MAGELSPDDLEARSIRYALHLRLALLSSGNWTVFWQEEGGEEKYEVMGGGLDVGGLETLAIAQRKELERWGERLKGRAEGAGRGAVQEAEQSAEELGL